MVKVMIEGKLIFAYGKLPGVILLFLLVLVVSTALSGSWHQSFWGMAFEIDTLFNFILFTLVFFLFANLIKPEQVKKVLSSFLVGAGVLALFFLIQSFWKQIFPWDFTQVSGFNPIGSVQVFGIFLGGAFAVLLALVGLGKKIGIKIVLGILLFLPIFLINQWLGWLGIGLASAIIVGLTIKNLGVGFSQQDFRKLILPLFVLTFSLTLIIIKAPTGLLLTLPPEIGMTNKASLDIATATLKEGPKQLIFGSGLATFSYQYALYRGIGPNLTDFWQIRFDQGTTAASTFLTTTGVSGVLAIFLIIAVFLFQAFKIFRQDQNVENEKIKIATFVGSLYYLVAWFFHPNNFSLTFALFLMLGLWVAINAKNKEFLFTQSPQKAFLIMLSGTILVAISIVGIYSVSQKYIAVLNYTKGIGLVNAQEPKLDEGIKMINKAIQLDARDIYLRNLSQVILFKIKVILNDEELPLEQKQKVFQALVSNVEASADNATLLNPRNSQNWAQLGNIYRNLALFGVQGAGDLAILSYQKAIELDPQNPQLFLNLAQVYKAIAETAKLQISLVQATEKPDKEVIQKLEESYGKNLELVKQYILKSIELKKDYQPALDFKKEIEELK